MCLVPGPGPGTSSVRRGPASPASCGEGHRGYRTRTATRCGSRRTPRVRVEPRTSRCSARGCCSVLSRLSGVAVLADLGYQGLGESVTGEVYTHGAVDPGGRSPVTTSSTTTLSHRHASGSSTRSPSSSDGALCATTDGHPPRSTALAKPSPFSHPCADRPCPGLNSRRPRRNRAAALMTRAGAVSRQELAGAGSDCLGRSWTRVIASGHRAARACRASGNRPGRSAAEGGEGLADPLRAHRAGRAEGLGEEADPQLLEQPAGVDHVGVARGGPAGARPPASAYWPSTARAVAISSRSRAGRSPSLSRRTRTPSR